MQRIALNALLARLAVLLGAAPIAASQPPADPRPNILWITIED